MQRWKEEQEVRVSKIADQGTRSGQGGDLPLRLDLEGEDYWSAHRVLVRLILADIDELSRPKMRGVRKEEQ